ncbi:MAG: PEGA domain-containing protein [Chitinophagaceae bacterium]|nr:MAG: PEGA domain-containing protein [Chitinophagaceae bacterium]
MPIFSQTLPMKTLYLACISLASMLFSGCATIAHGPLQKFVVTADPRVAAVYIDGKHYGQTPIVIHMSRKRSHLLELRLDGYQPYQLNLKRKLDGWAYGNIMLGGLPGVAIDLLTGSIFRLTPKDIYPTLQASKRIAVNESIAVLITLKPEDNWEKIGALPEINR